MRADPGRGTPGGLGEAFDPVLGAARTGAAWALERLFTTYAAAVAGYLRSQGAEDPEGLANEVFFSAFRALASFAGSEQAFRSWLFTIAHNRLVDERRRRGRRVQTTAVAEPDDRPDDGANPEAWALASLGNSRVRTLLDGLSDDQRDVLLLRIVGDLTVDQVAEAVGKRPGAVKALQRRGLAALREQLEREGVTL